MKGPQVPRSAEREDPSQLSRRTLLQSFGAGAGLVVPSNLLVAPAGEAVSVPEKLAGGQAARYQAAGATEQIDESRQSQETETMATIAQGVDATILDPFRFGSQVDNNILYHVFDQLIWRGAGLDLEPMLAESWEVLDELTWEFKLQEGVKFHNGEDFNADAVKFSIERAGDESIKPTIRFLRDVPLDRVEIVDPHTVRFITTQPHALMLDHLNELMILAPRYYSSVSPDEAALKPVGTGPYKFVEWVRDDHVTLAAHPDYWKGTPAIDTLVWRSIPEASTRIAELGTGGADVIVNVPPDKVDQVDEDEETRAEAIQGGRRIFIGISLGFEPFRDERVRQALNYAVDVDTIIETILNGYGERMATIANEPWVNPDLEPYPYDPAKAKQLLAEAGYGDGFDVVMTTPQGRYIQDRDVATVVASYLDQVGVKTTVEVIEWSVFLETLRERTTAPLFFLGLGAWFNGQDELRSVQKDDTYSATQWVSEEFEQKYAELVKTFDDVKRRELSHELQAIVHKEAPWIFLYKQYDLYGVRERLQWSPRPDERMYFYGAEIRS